MFCLRVSVPYERHKALILDALEPEIINSVLALRERSGLSASTLAERVGISRQAMYAIEAGSYVPNTAVSLRLARELGVSVDEIFQLSPEAAAQDQVARATVLESGRTPLQAGEPVQLCYVNDRLVAVAATPGEFWLASADGVARESATTSRRLRIDVRTEEKALHNRLLVSGCDPAMSLLTRHLQRAGIDLLLAHQNSSQSLAALKRGDVHIAGTHLRRSGADDSNLSTIALTFSKNSVAVISFATWQEGIVMAPGNPKHIRKIEDLAQAHVRFVNRESGAGCRALLDAELARLGLRAKNIQGYEDVAYGHLAVASRVKSGVADCGIATQAAARVFGLGFVPIEEARYDLVLRRENLGTPAVQKLLDTVSHASFRRELMTASGYETRVTGSRVL